MTEKMSAPSGENIVLIGMPGCGKSTVGVVCAKMLGYRFVDTDLLIQEKYGDLLWRLIEKWGCEEFIRREEEVLLSVTGEKLVIATGGSAVYGDRAMQHLRSIGRVIYLRQSYRTVRRHIGTTGHTRGIVYRRGADLRTLYAERTPLYEKYAHRTVDTDRMTVAQSAAAVTEDIQ